MTSHADRLADLERRIRTAIPVTRELAFSLEAFDGQSLTVRAPIAAHVNDKDTFFAGSQSLLLTLAGWSLTTLLAEADGDGADVLAVQSELSYCAPVRSDMVITVRVTTDDAEQFRQRLARKGRAPLAITAEGVDDAGTVGARFGASYLARRLD